MNSDRKSNSQIDSQRLGELFSEALNYPPERREAFLSAACASEPALRDELASLLAHCDSGGALSEPFVSGFDAFQLLAQSPALEPGDSLGIYVIVRLIGKGGMGEVYLAHDSALDRQVAIKLLPRALARDAVYLDRLEKEARAASRLNQPNILTIHQFVRAEDRCYLVTEWINGATIRERLQHSKLTPQEAFLLSGQIALALNAAHAEGILHRDIKPENLMVRRDGMLKVLDFGLAKRMALPGGNSQVTSRTQGTVIGTVAYMSPEQLRGEELDSRTDIWSWGIVFYEMLAGCRPFEGSSPADTITAILTAEPAFARIPSQYRSLMAKALRKRREERFSGTAELVAELNSETTPSSSFSKRAKMTSLVIASLALIAVSVTLVWQFVNRNAVTTPAYGRILPITNSGNIPMAAISPDGRYLAFVTISGEQQGLWLRQLSTRSDSLKLPLGPQQYSGFTFSPDGAYIYYVMEAPGGNGLLWRMPVIGGKPVQLASDVDGVISISPDGTHLAFTRGNPASGTSSLMIALADGTQERPLSIRKANEFFVPGAMAWSPDGGVIAAAVWNTAGTKRRIAIVGTNLRSGEQKNLIDRTWVSVDSLAWRGEELFLTGSESDSLPAFQLFRLELKDQRVTTLTNDAEWYSSLSLAANGNAVLVRTQRNASVWVSGSRDPAKVKRITPGGSQYFGVSWTANHHLLTQANVGGVPQSWLLSEEGQSIEKFADDVSEQRYPRTCGNKYVLFTSARTGNWKIWRMDLDGRNARQLTAGTSTDGSPVCTPDGASIIYNSDRSGKTTLWRMSIDGAQIQSLTSEVSYYPEISPDGKLVACTYLDAAAHEGSLAVLPLAGGAPIRRFKNMAAPVRWGPGAGMLSFIRTDMNGVSNLFARSMFGDAERQITHLDRDEIFSFDWSRDRSQLALVRGSDINDAVILERLTDSRN